MLIIEDEVLYTGIVNQVEEYTHTHTHTHTCIYAYIYIYMYMYIDIRHCLKIHLKIHICRYTLEFWQEQI